MIYQSSVTSTKILLQLIIIFNQSKIKYKSFACLSTHNSCTLSNDKSNPKPAFSVVIPFAVTIYNISNVYFRYHFYYSMVLFAFMHDFYTCCFKIILSKYGMYNFIVFNLLLNILKWILLAFVAKSFLIYNLLRKSDIYTLFP